MSTYRLETLFAPRSVAVVGASPRVTSPGRAVLSNLQRAGFAGTIGLVNPHYPAIEGVAAVKSYAKLAQTPDLVVIAVPPPAVPSGPACPCLFSKSWGGYKSPSPDSSLSCE